MLPVFWLDGEECTQLAFEESQWLESGSAAGL